jgi:hypothetical protein
LADLVLAALLAVMSPEELLVSLCDTAGTGAGAPFWADTRSAESPQSGMSVEGLAAVLRASPGLSVDPGPPDLVSTDEAEGSYLVSFPEARWSWSDSAGTDFTAVGGTTVQMERGSFYWVELPVFGGGIGLRPEQRILLGFLATALVLLLGALALWWVRRRFLAS